MRNILLIIGEMIVCYLAIIILYKKYKTDGLYTYGILATFSSCIISLKQIDIFNVSIPLGLAVSISIIITGNLITQKKGPEEIKTYLLLIFITILFSFIFLNLSGLMEISQYNEISNKSYNSIFKYNIRIYLSLAISLITSTYLSSKLYYLIKRVKNKIILSNIFSIIIVELIDNILFILISYLFEYKGIEIIICIVFRYMIKTILGIIGTIPIYIANKFN